MSGYRTYQIVLETEDTMDDEKVSLYLTMTKTPDAYDTWTYIQKAANLGIYRHVRTDILKDGEFIEEYKMDEQSIRGKTGEVRIALDMEAGEIQLKIGVEILDKPKVNWFLSKVPTKMFLGKATG